MRQSNCHEQGKSNSFAREDCDIGAEITRRDTIELSPNWPESVFATSVARVSGEPFLCLGQVQKDVLLDANESGQSAARLNESAPSKHSQAPFNDEQKAKQERTH